LWALLGGLSGLLAGMVLGGTLGCKLGITDPWLLLALSLDRGILIGVFGAIFVGTVALADGFIQSRRKPRS
jgi:hypothetical protein